MTGQGFVAYIACGHITLVNGTCVLVVNIDQNIFTFTRNATAVVGARVVIITGGQRRFLIRHMATANLTVAAVQGTGIHIVAKPIVVTVIGLARRENPYFGITAGGRVLASHWPTINSAA